MADNPADMYNHEDYAKSHMYGDQDYPKDGLSGREFAGRLPTSHKMDNGEHLQSHPKKPMAGSYGQRNRSGPYGPNNLPPDYDDGEGPSDDRWIQSSLERAAGPPRNTTNR